MSKIDKVFTLEIAPEQFIDACSTEELCEIDMLLSSPRFQEMMEEASQKVDLGDYPDGFDPERYDL